MATFDTTKNDPSRPRTGPASETDRGPAPGKAGQAKEAAAKKAQDLKETAADKARPRMEEAREEGRRNLESTAQALRHTADSLKQEDHEAMARYTEWAAGQVDTVADYFRDRNVDAVMHDVRSAARKNPAIILGGALMAGFMAARFLKASEPIRQGGVGYADRSRAYDYPAARPPAGPDEHPYRPYDTV